MTDRVHRQSYREHIELWGAKNIFSLGTISRIGNKGNSVVTFTAATAAIFPNADHHLSNGI